MLTFRQCYNENEQSSPKTQLILNVACAAVQQPSDAVFEYLKIAEGENPPWKDPWQWRDLLQKLWKFWP